MQNKRKMFDEEKKYNSHLTPSPIPTISTPKLVNNKRNHGLLSFKLPFPGNIEYEYQSIPSVSHSKSTKTTPKKRRKTNVLNNNNDKLSLLKSQQQSSAKSVISVSSIPENEEVDDIEHQLIIKKTD